LRRTRSSDAGRIHERPGGLSSDLWKRRGQVAAEGLERHAVPECPCLPRLLAPIRIPALLRRRSLRLLARLDRRRSAHGRRPGDARRQRCRPGGIRRGRPKLGLWGPDFDWAANGARPDRVFVGVEANPCGAVGTPHPTRSRSWRLLPGSPWRQAAMGWGPARHGSRRTGRHKGSGSTVRSRTAGPPRDQDRVGWRAGYWCVPCSPIDLAKTASTAVFMLS
jgi:hypothetical protein